MNKKKNCEEKILLLSVDDERAKDKMHFGAPSNTRVRYLFKEGSLHRKYIAAFTKTRLELMSRSTNIQHPVANFWFANQIKPHISYLLMNNIYANLRPTPMLEIIHTVNTTEKTVRKIIFDAEELGMVITTLRDGRSKLVWPTINFLHYYERGVMEHIEILQKEVGEVNPKRVKESYTNYLKKLSTVRNPSEDVFSKVKWKLN